MSRNERMPGWGDRIRLVRERVGLDKKAFAGHFGVTDGSYSGWELKNSGTSASTIKRGLISLGVPDVDRTLSWLADGEGSEPYWLKGEPGSPIPPEGPGRLIAMPFEVLEAGRQGFQELDRARVAGEIQSAGVMRAYLQLEKFSLPRQDSNLKKRPRLRSHGAGAA